MQLNQAQIIALYQPTLQSIALRMLGSLSDAEDAVQDSFAKWLTVDTSKIENAKAYLVKMVTNTCLNKLQQRKMKNLLEEEVSETLEDVDTQSSLFHFDFENQLSEAWSFLQSRLEPLETAVYVLREVFQIDYEDLQEIAGRKADNCRKIVSRAKEKLKRPGLPKIKVAFPDRQLLDSLIAAHNKGGLTQLISDFSFDLFKKKSR